MTDSHPLRTYLDREGIAYGAFAAQLGISAPLLSLILSGQRRVSLSLALRIEASTGGAVTGEQLAASQPKSAEAAE